MSDTSSLANTKVAIPNELAFVLPMSGPRARSFRSNQLSQNRSSYLPDETCTIGINSRKNCFLDPTQTSIQFTIYNEGLAGASITDFYVDNFASSFIQRIDIYHGSSVLESINNYGVLASAVSDCQLGDSLRPSLSNHMGCAESGRKGQLIKSGTSMTFNLPVLSGIIGTLAQKYLPVFLADDISVLVTWASAANAVCWPNVIGTTPGKFSISSPQLQCQFLELSESGMALIDETTSLSSDIFIPTTSYRHFSSTQAEISGECVNLIPARFASLKSLMVCPRPVLTTGLKAYSNSSRVNPNWTQFSFRVGSLDCPTRPVKLSGVGTSGYSEAFVELQKSMHAYGNFSNAGILSQTNYSKAHTELALTNVVEYSKLSASYENAFLIAIDMESFSGRANGGLLCGTNTLSSSTFLVTNVDIPTDENYNLDTFAYFDSVLVLNETGLYQVRF